MKVVALCIFMISSFSLIAQNSIADADEFLDFLRVDKNIKILKEDKLTFDSLNFQYPPDSLKYSLIDAFHQKAICYWIKASPMSCDSIKKQVEKNELKWKDGTVKRIKVIPEKDQRVKYHRLSDPIFYQNLVVIKVVNHNEYGATSGIIIYKREENSWSYMKTLAPMAN